MSGEAACPTQRASRSVADGVAATAAANRSTRISGATAIGANGTERSRRGADEALAPTDFGKWLKDDHIELYGWVKGGRTAGTATVPRQRAPALPPACTRQRHFNSVSLYGENYRHTTSLGIATYQLQTLNNFNG